MPSYALIADDDAMIRCIMRGILESMDIQVDEVSLGADALQHATDNSYDMIFLDLHFPDCSDLSILQAVRQKCPQTDVILVTAETANLTLVEEATRLGVFDYIPKPLREDDIRIRVTRLQEFRLLRSDRERLVNEMERGHEVVDIIGQSPVIRSIVEKAKELGPYDIPVLVTGETGSGKELIARAVHNAGPRRGKPFVAVNCAALPETLAESELFGHERGSFTGAHMRREGAFEEAGEGTLFLDEIGDMPQQAQATLLRVLDGESYRSVGGKEKRSSARVVCATNRNLEERVREGLFRQDLLYRINRVTLTPPPLRERKGDIPLLIAHFLAVSEKTIGKRITKVEDAALDALSAYDWPGNVRELKNEVERACIFATGPTLRLIDFSPQILIASSTEEDEMSVPPESLTEVQQMIEALQLTKGNISKAAEHLGVHRNTLHRWMRKFSIPS